VLDFWATWCGPCKASLPAMQKLVNKYKNNPDVKFLFIHTMEHTLTPKQEAIAYLKNNSFNLDLFMDLKDAKTKANPAASALKVVAIPAKFVIDGQGDIRFKLTGFYGGDDAAVAEVSAMVDLISQGK
ncbi:MAG: TlpA family protein disulfide reductase, partial [Pedobacter sp.]